MPNQDRPPVVGQEIELRVNVDPRCHTCAESISWDMHEPSPFAYYGPDALARFFEDLVMGKPLPLTFNTHHAREASTVVAITLFMHRHLLLLPGAMPLVAAADFYARWGEPAMAHLDPELGRFFRFLGLYLDTRDNKQKLTEALGWMREYLETGVLPHFGGRRAEPPRVLDVGTTGFVLAETPGDMASMDFVIEAWVELYRMGHLRGVLVGPMVNARRNVVAARKSPLVDFDLGKAAAHLNEMERAMGELPEWRVDADGLWLSGPPDGTLILVQHMLEVFVRV